MNRRRRGRPRKKRAITPSSTGTPLLSDAWAEIFKYTNFFADPYTYHDGVDAYRNSSYPFDFHESDMLLSICKDLYHNVFCNDSYDEVLWHQKCRAVWFNKVPCSYICFERLEDVSWREKLRRSVIDSRRTSITKDELCSLEFAARLRGDHGDDSRDPYWNFYHALLALDGTLCLAENPRYQQIYEEHPSLCEGDRFKVNPMTAVRTFHSDGTISNPNPDPHDQMPYQNGDSIDNRHRWLLCKTRWDRWTNRSVSVGGPFLKILDPKNATYQTRGTPCTLERTKRWGWLIYNELSPQGRTNTGSMVFCHPKKDLPGLHYNLEECGSLMCSCISEEEEYDDDEDF